MEEKYEQLCADEEGRNLMVNKAEKLRWPLKVARNSVFKVAESAGTL
jgi:hypothetical protein